MPISAVFFDLDNTLIDFMTFKKETAKAAAHAMVQNGLPATDTEAYGKIFSVYDEKGIEHQKTFFEVVRQYGLEIDRAERIQQAAIMAYLRRKFEVLRPYPMVLPTLAKLRAQNPGMKMGIVTDAPRNKAWQRLVICNLADEFDFVVTHDDTKETKPHPSPFNLALNKSGLLAPACLFVGDNPSKDIKGAREVGMLTCLAKYGVVGKAAGHVADYEIARFDELPGLVKRLE